MLNADIPYLETHLNIALSLYKQRVNCISQFYVESTVQQAIEKRLLVHLHVLANAIKDDEPEPKDDDELFIYISRMLLSPNEDYQYKILQFAKNIFIEYISPKGLIDAFCLFYNDDINELLSELFKSNKELRSTILTIWNFSNQQVPLAVLNQSELQQSDVELQSAVLQYHADQTNVSVELFQKYYNSLINDVQKNNISSAVLFSALWGGMLKRDSNILVAIRRAIELEADDTQREKYLRLSALLGGNNLIPIFKSVSENRPEFGSYLIALLGTTESVKVLFSMLQNPRVSLSIIPAWQMLTGQELKSVPRISLVDDNLSTEANDETDDVPLIADIESAQLWAKKNVSQWTENTRYIHGVVCNKQSLMDLSYQLSGQIGKDVFDLLSLQSESNLNLNNESWIVERNEILSQLSSTNLMSNG